MDYYDIIINNIIIKEEYCDTLNNSRNTTKEPCGKL